MNEVHHPDDRSFRMLFQHPRVIADLLRALVREPWVDELDLDSLEQLPTNYSDRREAPRARGARRA